jgi:hypothetical protein
VIIDAETGKPADPAVFDRNSGKVMSGEAFHSAPGPAADERTRARHRKDASPERMA